MLGKLNVILLEELNSSAGGFRLPGTLTTQDYQPNHDEEKV